MMDRDEEIGIHAPRLHDALGERHEIIAVADEHRAHRGLAIDEGLEPARDGERHVLLARAAASARARILAAVPRVDRDDDEPVGLRPCGSRRRLGRLRRLELDDGQIARRERRLRDLADRIGHEQREQRISRFCGVDVEHQAMLVFADGSERKHRRLHFRLQVEHDAHHVRPVQRDAHRLDVRIGVTDLRRQLAQFRVEIHALEVEHQALGARDREELVLDRARGLEGDARVFLRGPDARGEDLLSREGARRGARRER